MDEAELDPTFELLRSELRERDSRLLRGSCILQRPEVAEIVASAINFGRGERHLVHSWCIMPNHVHWVNSLLGETKLSKFMHSIKSYTSHEINKLLGTSGSLWERESFDHVVRSSAQFEWLCNYVEDNPFQAGLCAHPSEWAYSSANARWSTDTLEHWIDPRRTPFVRPTSRGELPHLDKRGAVYFVTFRLLDAVASDMS
jgi:REP element-mobilizing transposase RayT